MAHVRIVKTALGEAASAAAIEVFAPTLLGYAGNWWPALRCSAVGGRALADGVERD